MRRCIICATDQDEVRLTQVVPAIWTGFNNWVVICGGCHASETYKKLVKQKKIVNAAPAPRSQADPDRLDRPAVQAESAGSGA